jgi:hypothetical protein
MELSLLLLLASFYLYTSGSISLIYWLDQNDTNILRLGIIGIIWPFWILKGTYWILQKTVQYFRSRFLAEVRELLPTKTMQTLPQNIQQSESFEPSHYKTGQWQ